MYPISFTKRSLAIVTSLCVLSCSNRHENESNTEIPFPAPAIGSFYYSDGSWSSEYDDSRSVIGIIFWAGDPTADDAALRRDHPDCTHGLAVALDQEKSAWQPLYEKSGSPISKWIKDNISDYAAPESDNGPDKPLQKISGYNNTKAIEAYNAAPENTEWPVEAITKTIAYRSRVKAPATSSNWYLPSPKELSLLCSGEIEGDIYIKDNILSNVILINERIESIGKEPITANAFWSSTEASVSGAPQTWETAWNYFFDDVTRPLSYSFKAWPDGWIRPIIAF